MTTPHFNTEPIQELPGLTSLSDLAAFPTESALTTAEQRQRFELLRLAFFALKLRKLEQPPAGKEKGKESIEFRRSLLRHAIFQQVVALIDLGAREQAFQILAACRQ